MTTLASGNSVSLWLDASDKLTVTNGTVIGPDGPVTVTTAQTFGPYAGGAMLRVIGGSGCEYTFQDLTTAFGTSASVLEGVPKIISMVGAALPAVVTATPGSGGTIAGEYTTSSAAEVSAGTASWSAWPYGSASSEIVWPLTTSVTAIRMTASTADGSVVVAAEAVTAAVTFKAAALLGDSLTGQHVSYGNGVPIVGSQGFWNWANWLVGAPFDFEANIGTSGAKAVDIFSRVWQIPGHIGAVFVCAGINDVLAVSSSANEAARDAAVADLTGTINAGCAYLKNAGNVVAIATIPPNVAFTVGDARIDVLDRVNAYIATLPSLGLADQVMDLFAACWDSTQATARLFKTNYSTDGTHLTNLSGQAAGIAFIDEMGAMYRKTVGASSFGVGAQFPLKDWSAMRVISGVSSLISTGGSGTAATDMAGGWRSVRGSGVPTWVCSIVDRPETPAHWVGPLAAPTAPGEKLQKYVITATASGEALNTQLTSALTANATNGVSYGDTIAIGAEVWIEDAGGVLNSASAKVTAFIAVGTSPADQPYGTSTTESRSTAGVNSVAGTDHALPTAFRAFIRSQKVRVPENVNGTTGVTLMPYLSLNFSGAGTATAYWGRPQIYRWVA